MARVCRAISRFANLIYRPDIFINNLTSTATVCCICHSNTGRDSNKSPNLKTESIPRPFMAFKTKRPQINQNRAWDHDMCLPHGWQRRVGLSSSGQWIDSWWKLRRVFKSGNSAWLNYCDLRLLMGSWKVPRGTLLRSSANPRCCSGRSRIQFKCICGPTTTWKIFMGRSPVKNANSSLASDERSGSVQSFERNCKYRHLGSEIFSGCFDSWIYFWISSKSDDAVWSKAGK
jgi:hypothetical protein